MECRSSSYSPVPMAIGTISSWRLRVWVRGMLKSQSGVEKNVENLPGTCCIEAVDVTLLDRTSPKRSVCSVRRRRQRAIYSRRRMPDVRGTAGRRKEKSSPPVYVIPEHAGRIKPTKEPTDSEQSVVDLGVFGRTQDPKEGTPHARECCSLGFFLPFTAALKAVAVPYLFCLCCIVYFFIIRPENGSS